LLFAAVAEFKYLVKLEAVERIKAEDDSAMARYMAELYADMASVRAQTAAGVPPRMGASLRNSVKGRV
jgi:hypothetical protein